MSARRRALDAQRFVGVVVETTCPACREPMPVRAAYTTTGQRRCAACGALFEFSVKIHRDAAASVIFFKVREDRRPVGATNHRAGAP